MKILISIILLTISINSFCHDYKIKDKYGRVTGYIDKDDNALIVKDKYGRFESKIEDYEITDEYGNFIADIEEND